MAWCLPTIGNHVRPGSDGQRKATGGGSYALTMYYLATVFPFIKRVRIPITRDQAMLLMLALNEFLLGLETYLAHSISGTIMPKEWIPILFGPVISLPLFIWAPPILGPLTFALVGLIGISAVWLEEPPDSGHLTLLGGRRLHLPFSKTNAFFFMVGLG